MGETKYFGFNSDAEYRAAVAKEIEAQEAEARESKPIYASELAREASPTVDLLVQATGKLVQAVTAHQGQMGVNDAWWSMQQMIEGTDDVEAAAIAVIAFASEYPDYAPNAVEALQEVWGEWGEMALQETVEEISYAEAAVAAEQQQEEYDEHVAHRAEVIRDLSNDIAAKDGDAVRDVAAAMASNDETLMWGNDVDAAATLLGLPEARQGRRGVGREGGLPPRL